VVGCNMKKGFFLLEMVIALAVLALLLTASVPSVSLIVARRNFDESLNRAFFIAEAFEEALTAGNRGYFSGALQGWCGPLVGLQGNLVPTYAAYLPMQDAYGFNIQVMTQHATYDPVLGGITIKRNAYPSDYLIRLTMRGGEFDGWVSDPFNFSAGFYAVNSQADLSRDVIIFNGRVIHGPKRYMGRFIHHIQRSDFI